MFQFLRRKAAPVGDLKTFEFGDGNLRIDLPHQFLTSEEEDKTVVVYDPKNENVAIRLSALFISSEKEPEAKGLGSKAVIDSGREKRRKIRNVDGKVYFDDPEENGEGKNYHWVIGIENVIVIISCWVDRNALATPYARQLVDQMEALIRTIRLSPMQTQRGEIPEGYQQVVSELTDEHADQLRAWRECANQAAKDLLDLNSAPFLGGYSDLAIIQKVLEHPKFDRDNDLLCEGLGVVLGDVFARALSMKWVSISDPQGSIPALRYESGGVMIYPSDMIIKRVRREESFQVEDLFQKIAAYVQKSKS